MKKYMLSTLLALTFVQTASAYHYHIPTGDMISAYNFNHETNTALYYDNVTAKKKTVNLSDLSAEVKELNGLKQGHLVILKDQNLKFCETFHVFEIGVAYIGCQTDKINRNIGMHRPKEMRGMLSVEEIIGEIPEMDGFKKKDKVTLLKTSGSLNEGRKVIIEAIFPTGEALIQKAGFKIDTSSLRLKFNVERVQLSDLQK